MSESTTARLRARGDARGGTGIAILLPFYNEEAWLPRTIETLRAQSHPPSEVILVDNGSTDRSRAIAEAQADRFPRARVRVLTEPRPGKIHALASGLAAVSAPFVALCDADTLYPPHYLAAAQAAFADDEKTVAVLATDLYTAPASLRSLVKRARIAAVGRILARQCHSGGYGQIFRTDVLRACGGFSEAIWPFVLEDHEIVHRVLKHGRVRYPFALWCHPADRRDRNARTRWTLAERLLYHLTPFAMKDWFFYRFLWQRWSRRDLRNVRLRQRNWA
ncbi:MAG: glycosyltransferase family 2 protein [Alphaproteobacteria bacterium]|nr:MAG: glycosyltransferase family 2 protein [Alphaproteobacteria bacterium]